jgi:DNA-directed RNA polymerase specialized sigma24 family protein
MAARRDIRRERIEVPPSPEAAAFPQWMLDHVDQSRPTPDEQVVVLDEFQRLLGSLPEDLRQIVMWKLDGYKNAEIAEMIGRTVRSVELKLQIIRRRLEAALPSTAPSF